MMEGNEEKKKLIIQEPKVTPKSPAPKAEYEATYTIEELVDAAENFKTTRVVVRAALSNGGKEAYTLREATKLIERMKNKEVKA